MPPPPFLWLPYDVFFLCNRLSVQINYEGDLSAATVEPKFGYCGSNVSAMPCFLFVYWGLRARRLQRSFCAQCRGSYDTASSGIVICCIQTYSAVCTRSKYRNNFINVVLRAMDVCTCSLCKTFALGYVLDIFPQPKAFRNVKRCK